MLNLYDVTFERRGYDGHLLILAPTQRAAMKAARDRRNDVVLEIVRLLQRVESGDVPRIIAEH